MTITLRPDQEKVVAEAIESGAYHSPDEVIQRALEILRSEDEWLTEHKAELAEKLDRALQDFERGDFFSPEESRAEMQKRKAAWLDRRKR